MRRQGEKGFTLIELMVALTVLVIGLLGLMGIVMVSLRASSFSRHGTEATVLAEDKLEELRTVSDPGAYAGTESHLDPRGNAGSGGIFTRRTTVNTVTDDADVGPMVKIVVAVSWDEREQGNEDPAANFTRTITLTTERMP